LLIFFKKGFIFDNLVVKYYVLKVEFIKEFLVVRKFLEEKLKGFFLYAKEELKLGRVFPNSDSSISGGFSLGGT
jgi:hypothetical protein